MAKSLVSVVKCVEQNVEKKVSDALRLIGGLDDVKGKKFVTIKPNLSTLRSSASGATTDLRVIEALIKEINYLTNCEIRIVETNNSHATADKTFEYLGYTDLSDRYSNVQCVNLSKDKKVRVKLDGEIFSSLQVPETMIFSDYFITAAKLKTHVDYVYTGALKNQFGLLVRSRARYHGLMSQVLFDLNRFYKPDLAVIDGLIGMQGFGPCDGQPKFAGVIMASRNLIAIDTVGAKIMKLDPSRIPYLGYVQKKKLWDFKKIMIVGAKISEIATDFEFIPTKYYYIGTVSLFIQRLSRYLENLATLLSLSRSALSTVKLSTLEQKLSYLELVQLAKETVTKIDD